MKIVCIQVDNSMDEIEIDDDNILLNLKKINDIEDNIELIYYWIYDNCIIECYACLASDKNLKNMHKLPINGISDIIDEKSSDIQLYNNIYIACKKNKKYIDFHVHDYGNFFYIISL